MRWFALFGALALALAAALVHAHALQRLPLAAIEHSVDALVERTAAIEAGVRASSGPPAHPELPANPFSGPVVRLEDELAEAEYRPAATAPPAATAYEPAGELALAPVGAPERATSAAPWQARGDELWTTVEDLGLEPTAIDRIEVRMRHRSGGRFQLGWSRELLEEWDPLRLGAVSVDVASGGELRTYHIAGSALRYRLKQGERLARLLIRPSDVADDSVEIAGLRVVPRAERYAAAAFGRTDEIRAGEHRPALHVLGPGELRFRVRLPEAAPRLELGLGLASGAAPLPVSLALEADGEQHLLRRASLAGEGWSDQRIPLEVWSGREVVLVLRVEAPGVALFSHPTIVGSRREPFNVLLVLEDTLRADHLGAYGHRRPTSPARDALARRGVLFEYAVSQATKTRPSCPSLMTSLHPTATGVWSFSDRLDPRYLTLAEVLSRQGFETAAFVQNPNAGPAAGLHQGYDHFFDSLVTGRRPQDVFSQQTIDWIEAHRERNLFLYLHVLDPHGIYDPPPPYDAWYREEGPGEQPAWPNRRRHDPAWVEKPTLEGRRLLYDGEIRHNDERLGAFLDALEARGWLEHTLVVLVSDHGEHLGEHALWEHHPPGFLQVLHVPLLMAHPTRLPSGLRVTSPVQMLDVMPTILALAGVEPNRLPLQGESLLPLLEQPDAPRLAISEEVTAYEGRDDPRVFGSFFQTGRHLLLGYERRWRWWLPGLRAYAYARDPGEEQPLLSAWVDPLVRRRAERSLRKLKQANLSLWRAITAGAAEEVIVDPAVQEQLRALGYVE